MGVTAYFTCARVMGSLTRGLYGIGLSGFVPSRAGSLLGARVLRCAAAADAIAPSRVPAARRPLGGAVMTPDQRLLRFRIECLARLCESSAADSVWFPWRASHFSDVARRASENAFAAARELAALGGRHG